MIEQPMPGPGREDVLPVVRVAFIATLVAQDRKGRQKYGGPLRTWNGRDAGEDAWQELVDLAQYLTQLRLEHADALAEIARLNALLRERDS